MSRTIVFGLDGATFDLLDDWLADGRLETLQGLIDAGGGSELASCTPATTPPAWTSLTTGVNPGKHGVFGFYRRFGESYEVFPVSDEDVRTPRLWDYTTAHDKTALVVNVPVTHPARPLDGALVPGYLAPDSPTTYPRDLLSTVGMDDYHVYADSEDAGTPDDTLLSEWLSLTDDRRDLTLRLMEQYDWDLLFVEFQKTDGVVHKFSDSDSIRTVYERVDECMGSILDEAGGDPNVVVVSDHGIGQPKEWAVALNTWFVDEGYATTTVGSERERSWRTDETAAADQPTVLDRLLGMLGTVGITKQQLERVLARLGLYEFAVRLLPEGTGSTVADEVIDNAASDAFYQGMGFSGVDVGVTINAADFYDEGSVGADEYQALREELMDRLRELRGPDGQRAFQSVRPREAVYDGPYVAEAPDIVLRQAAQYVIGSSQPRGKTFIPADEGRVDHTRQGLLVASGPDIAENWSLDETPSITDITPTLLQMLDVPLAERFDGDPLDVLSVDREPEWQTYDHETTDGTTDLTTEELDALERRLRGMGYLE